MSVQVVGGDGSLNFEASIDLSNFDVQINKMQSGIDQAFKKSADGSKAFQDSLMDVAKSTGAALDPKTLRDWTGELGKATAQVQALLAKGASSLDPTKLEAFKQQIAGTTGEFDQLKDTIAFIQQNLGSLNLNPEDTKTLGDSIKTIAQSFDDFTEKEVTATSRLRALKDEMVNMEDKGSPAFKAVQAEAAKLQNHIDETNKSVKLLGSSTSGLSAGVQAVRGLIGGFEAIAGAVGLASGNSENMEKVVGAIIQAMGVLNGVQEVAATISKTGALNQFLLAQFTRQTAAATIEQTGATIALTAAQAAETTVTEGLTVAQVELDAAMAANPALILLTALAAIAAAIYFLTKRTDDASEASVKLNKALLDQYKTSQLIYELSKHSFQDTIALQESNIEAAQASGASQKEILQRQIELNNIKKIGAAADLKKAQDDLNYASESTKNLKDQINGYLELHGLKAQPLDLDFSKPGTIDTLVKQLSTLRNGIDILKNSSKADDKKNELQKMTDDATLLEEKLKAVIDKTQNNYKVNAAGIILIDKAIKLSYDQQVNDFTSAQEAKTLALAKSADDQLKLTLDSIKAQTAAQLDPKLNPNLTPGEISKIKATSLKEQADAVFQANQKEYADTAKLLNSEAALYKEGTKERLDLELKALEVQKQAQLQQIIQLDGQDRQYRKLSADQTATITNEYNAKIAEKQKEFNKGVAADALETQISLDKAKLASITLSARDELDTKRKLIDDQQALDISNAQFSINNEQQLAAKIKEINSTAASDKQKLDDEAIQHTLENNLKLIKAAGERSKAANNAILANPDSSAKNKSVATTGNLNIDIATIQKGIDLANATIEASLLTGNINVAKLIEERDNLVKEWNAANTKLGTAPKDTTGQTDRILNQVGNSISRLSGNLQQYNSSLADVFNSLGQIVKNAAIINKAFSDLNSDVKVNTEQNIAQGMEAALQLISMVVSAAAARAQAEKQFNTDLLSQQEAYNLALNENIRLNNELMDNVFTTDFQDQLKHSVEALVDAQQKYQKSLEALSQGQAKQKQKNVPSGSAILSGAGSGAVLGLSIGTAAGGGIFSIPGAVVGTVIGAVAGAIVGLFGGMKKKDVFVALLTEYPNLLEKNANGVYGINRQLANSLLTSNQLDDKTKQLVQDTLNWADSVKAADDQMAAIINDLAGSLGSDLSSALVKAFEDGTDASKAFAESVQKTMENVIQQMLFSNIFGPAFKDLQTKMEDSFQAGADFSWQDDLQNFFNQYGGLAKDFQDALASAQKEAAAAGLDIFQSTAAANKGNSLSGAIKGITEQQADLLAGQFGGLRLTAIDQLKVGQSSLMALNGIVYNTGISADKLEVIKATMTYLKLNGIKIAQ